MPIPGRAVTSATLVALSPRGCLATDGDGQMVLRMCLQPGKQRQEAILVAVERDDPGHLGTAGRKRSGLAEGEAVDGRRSLQRAAALEQHAAARRS